jgi:aryl-alcohol dehydrogenase
VLVRVVATGVCHTDIIIRDQYYPSPLPAVLGHEGSGVVEAVGSDVAGVAVGDHVVMSFMSCGTCRPCQSGHPGHCGSFFELNFGGGRADGSSASCDAHGHALHDHFFGQSSFGTYAIAHERNVVKVDKDAPLELLGPLGCGIQTGAGAVLSALAVKPGSSFAAFGSGAVGLSAVMAARVAGATTIIAVDVTPSRLALALELGATHAVNSREVDPSPPSAKSPAAVWTTRWRAAAARKCCVRRWIVWASWAHAALWARRRWARRRRLTSTW